MVRVWRPEDDLQELVFSFHVWDPVAQAQPSCLLSCLSSPVPFIFLIKAHCKLIFFSQHTCNGFHDCICIYMSHNPLVSPLPSPLIPQIGPTSAFVPGIFKSHTPLICLNISGWWDGYTRHADFRHQQALGQWHWKPWHESQRNLVTWIRLTAEMETSGILPESCVFGCDLSPLTGGAPCW